jgi:hypothetical protein
MLTAERLRELVHYDPETGIFVWLASTNMRGPRRGGKEAGGTTTYGYRRIRIDQNDYQSHRLAWLYTHGEWPSGEIDHINCVRDDNRLVNLRPASRAQQSANASKRSDNTSGLKGVSWNKQRQKWQAMIAVNRRSMNLGCFDNRDAAQAAYRAAAEKHFGEFAKIV